MIFRCTASFSRMRHFLVQEKGRCKRSDRLRQIVKKRLAVSSELSPYIMHLPAPRGTERSLMPCGSKWRPRGCLI